MDYALPVRGALELIDRLMQDARYREIPKFVWSAVQLPGSLELCIDSGDRRFLMKPQKASEAKALVRELLEGC
jgi:CheY-like chemotaxis protein